MTRARNAMFSFASRSVVLFTLACNAKASESATPSVRVKQPAVGDVAPRMAFVALDGDSLTVGDSARVATLVNVWATWCESCKEEFAELEHLRKEFAGRGFDVAAISVDQGSDAKVRKFVTAQGSTFRVAHDAAGRMEREYAISGLPTSFLLDRTGRVRWKFTGDFRLDSAGLVKAVRETVGQ